MSDERVAEVVGRALSRIIAATFALSIIALLALWPVPFWGWTPWTGFYAGLVFGAVVVTAQHSATHLHMKYSDVAPWVESEDGSEKVSASDVRS